MTEKLHGDTEFLFKTILSLKDEKQCAAFFEDLCTFKEIEAMAQRPLQNFLSRAKLTKGSQAKRI